MDKSDSLFVASGILRPLLRPQLSATSMIRSLDKRYHRPSPMSQFISVGLHS